MNKTTTRPGLLLPILMLTPILALAACGGSSPAGRFAQVLGQLAVSEPSTATGPDATPSPSPAGAAAATGVYVNGQELDALGLARLQLAVGPVAPGRYWVDRAGNGGVEGGPARWNLFELAAQRLAGPPIGGPGAPAVFRADRRRSWVGSSSGTLRTDGTWHGGYGR